jgi:hypothetical protein
MVIHVDLLCLFALCTTSCVCVCVCVCVYTLYIWLGFEFRNFLLQSRRSTTWVTPPVLYYFFCDLSDQFVCPSVDWITRSFGVSILSSLCILTVNSLSDEELSVIFLLFCRLFIHSGNCFQKHEVWKKITFVCWFCILVLCWNYFKVF